MGCAPAGCAPHAWAAWHLRRCGMRCAGVRRVHTTRWTPQEVSAQYQSSPSPSSPGGLPNPNHTAASSGVSLPRPSSTTGSAPPRTAPHTSTRSPGAGSGLRDWGGEGALLSSDGPDELYHQLVEVGTRWSDRHAQAEYLEEGMQLPYLPRPVPALPPSHSHRKSASPPPTTSPEQAVAHARGREQ